MEDVLIDAAGIVIGVLAAMGNVWLVKKRVKRKAVTEQLVSTNVSSVDAVSGILKDTSSAITDRHTIREERLD